VRLLLEKLGILLTSSRDFHFQDNDTRVNSESGSRLGYDGFNVSWDRFCASSKLNSTVGDLYE